MSRITRVYSDSNGDSHFADIEMELKEAGSIGRLSDTLPATGVVFREVAPTYDYHSTPHHKNNTSSCWTAKLKSKRLWGKTNL
jgi:hypothetical protein